jgi:predicted RNase H-like HicB family nuclease
LTFLRSSSTARARVRRELIRVREVIRLIKADGWQMTKKYTIIIEKGERNDSAYCPDLPGVAAAGETEEETVELMRGAIEFHLEGLKEDKEPIPEPSITARNVKVTV